MKLNRSTLAICMLAVFVPAAAQTIPHQITTLPAGVTWCDDNLVVTLLNNINQVRTSNSRSALVTNSTATKVAETRAVQFSSYMATHSPATPGFNPHEGYDTTAASFGYQIVGENLAYLTADPNYIVFGGWQDSLHLAAMLATDANVAGVACIVANGTPFWSFDPGIGSGSSTPAPTPADTAPAPTPTPAPTTSLDSEQAAFLQLINQFRSQNGVGPLQSSTTLQQSSQWMSNDMATKNYFSHTDSLGRSPDARISSFGYTYTAWGENIAAGNSDAQNTLNQWANACDPDGSGNCTYAHRVNMLNPGFKAIGIGRAYSANSSYGWYWTTDFGGVVDQSSSPTPTPIPVPTPAFPVISSFSANPSSITAGQITTLSWAVSGATSITIDNAIGDVTQLRSANIAPAQTTTFRITATNLAGNVSATTTVTVAPANVGSQPPTTPVISSAAVSPSRVDLTWTASVGSVGTLAGYRIYRDSNLLATVSANTLNYADTSIAPSSTYTYVVSAFDTAGRVSASAAKQVTTPAPVSSGVSCPAPALNAFLGCYFDNVNLTGSPVLTRKDDQINFDWGRTSPGTLVPPAILPSDGRAISISIRAHISLPRQTPMV